jgi:hypothetical protein
MGCFIEGETHELETSGEPDTTSQTGKQMDNELLQGETHEFQTPNREPDTTTWTLPDTYLRKN